METPERIGVSVKSSDHASKVESSSVSGYKVRRVDTHDEHEKL